MLCCCEYADYVRTEELGDAIAHGRWQIQMRAGHPLYDHYFEFEINSISEPRYKLIKSSTQLLMLQIIFNFITSDRHKFVYWQRLCSSG